MILLLRALGLPAASLKGKLDRFIEIFSDCLGTLNVDVISKNWTI